MAFPSRPTDNIEWAEDSNSLVDEPIGERARGFPFGYIPPVDQANWLQRAVGRWIDYFSKSAGGGFDSLPDLIDALAPGESAPLITPDLQPGREIKRLDINQPYALAADGQRFYWVEGTSITGYDFVADTVIPGVSVADIDTTNNVYLEANGDCVVLAYNSDDATAEARVITYETDLSARWSKAYSSANAHNVVGFALAGSSVYVTDNEATVDPKTYRLKLLDGAELATYSAANAFVRATNGRFVAFAVGAGTVSVRSPNLLTEYWSDAHGATVAIANMAADGSVLYVLTGDDDLIAYPLQESGAFPSPIETLDWGEVQIDADEVLLSPNGTGNIIGVHKDGRQVAAVWSTFAEDLDLASPISGFASDSSAVYIAGETTTAGDYAIWVIAKGQAPKIWRRLDPTDDNSWTRTLAAPI